ncbi:hypothetical protein ACWA1F_19580 [Flavobacterium sp. 3-218]
MRKITELLKFLLFVIVLLTITNCAPTEIDDDLGGQSTAEAKLWFENHKRDYDATILNYIENLEWESAIVSDDKIVEVPFTLNDNLKTSNENATLHNDNHRLVFVKDGQQNFKTFYIQIFSDDENSSSLGKSSTYYDAPNNFSGKIFMQDLNTSIVTSLQYKGGKKVQSGTTGKWREETYDCTFLGYWGEGGTFHPIKLLYCEGGSDEPPSGGPTTGGGGGGSSTPSTPTVDDDIIPSCESFNFRNEGSLWQVAMVKNISFRVIGVSPTGVRVTHVVSYPQAIYFGTPTNIKIGNTNISAGNAANVSAKVLQDTMQEVIDKYGGTDVSDLVLDQYFRQRLTNNYPLSIPGARVNFNSTSSVPSTEYQTNAFFRGDCN